MKYLFQERVQKGFPNEPLLAATQTKGVVRKEDYEERTVLAMKDLHLLKLVETGDFVISLRSFQGGLEISHCRGIISPAYTILTPTAKSRRAYFKHFFKSPEFIQSMTLFVTGIREGQNIDYERLSRAYLPLPSDDEQDAIGRYLDWINIRFSQAIRSKQRLIALLTEQKQAIIQRAVIRGLHPDVNYRPSGVDWLGEIPEHWDLKMLRQSATPHSERNRTDLPLLSVVREKGIILREGQTQEDNHNFIPDDLSNYKVVHKGDLAVNKMKAWQGSMGVSPYTGIVSPAYYVFRITTPINGRYLHYLMRNKAFVGFYKSISDGIRLGQWDLDIQKFKQTPILLPPPDEQDSIVEHIERMTSNIDRQIRIIERQIALICEYRTRLIADVVTGKLDVREAAARLPKVEMLEDNCAPCVESGEGNSDLGE